MNTQLNVKMSRIAASFAAAGIDMPKTGNRLDIKRVKCGNAVGIELNGRYIWGVSPREYWKFIKTL